MWEKKSPSHHAVHKHKGTDTVKTKLEDTIDFETEIIRNFINLDDTPSAYASYANQYVQVNTDEDALTFSTVTIPPTIYDAIVGTGTNDDYTTVSAALLAGANSIYVKDGDYAESGLTFNANTVIVGESRDGVDLQTGTNIVTLGANTIVLSNLTISGTGSATRLIDGGGLTTELYTDNVVIDHSSRTGALSIALYNSNSASKIRLNNTTIKTGNVAGSGNNPSLSLLDGIVWISNMEIVGGGTKARGLHIGIDAVSLINGIYLSGTFAPDDRAIDIGADTADEGTVITNIIDNSTGNIEIRLNAQIHFSNYYAAVGATTLYIVGDYNKVSNIDLNSGALSITTADGNILTNIDAGALTIGQAATACSNNYFTNATFTSITIVNAGSSGNTFFNVSNSGAFTDAGTGNYWIGEGTLGDANHYFTNTYSTDVYLNSTAFLAGASAGTIKVDGNLLIEPSTDGATTFQVTKADTTNVLTVDTTNKAFQITGATTLIADAAATKPLIVKAAASQSADLLEFQDSSGNMVLEVLADGDIKTDRWLDQDSNTFIGVDVAGAGNLAHVAGQTGYGNTFLGNEAGNNITTGFQNVFIGKQVGKSITTGSNNVGLGYEALEDLTTGVNNFGFGVQALYKVTSGSHNVCIGVLAGTALTTGESNFFMGTNSGASALTCYSNIGIGVGSLNACLDNNNVGIGASALRQGTTIVGNVAIGFQAGRAISTGDYNTILGYDAGYNVAGGTKNVFIGYQVGYNETGSNKLYIGNSNTTTPLIYGEFDGAGGVGVKIHTPAAAAVGLTVKGAASQSANLQEWQDSGGNILLNVQPDGDLEFPAGKNIVLQTTTGTKIGTATNQLLGFFNATPVAQQAYTAVSDPPTQAEVTAIRDALINLGLMASS